MIVLSDLHIVIEFGSVLFNLPAMVGLFVDRFAPLEFDQGSAWTPSRPSEASLAFEPQDIRRTG